MADYLPRAMNVLQDLQSLHVIINVEQCEFLRTKLTDTFLEVDRLIRPIRSLRPPGERLGLILHQYLSSNLSKFVDIVPRLIGGDGCSTSFALAIGEEIFNVIKRAEWLMVECCNEHWLFKAMELSATAEISEILRSFADLLPYALLAELGIDPSQCDDHFLNTMRGLVSKLTDGIWGEEVEVELIRRSRSDRRVLLSKVEKMLGKLKVSEVAPDFANVGEDIGLARLVRDRYTPVISSNWLPPEMSGNNINFDSVDVHGARVYTTLQCLGGKYSLLTLSLDCGGISDKLMKDICQEAALWKKYQHPYIVRLMGYWEANRPGPYLLYEFMEFNLEQLITKVRAVREIVPLEAIEMMLPVAKAIRYLHGHGVAHRSLNTENILCTVVQEDFSMALHDVTVKLMGFGEALEGASSSVQDRNWETASIHVTEFTAPEILLQKNSSIDFMKADVFSFGMVLLKVLTGQTNLDRFAFGGEGSPILQFCLESRGMEILNSGGMLPASLGNIIESSCHADPNMRPTIEDICSRLRLCKLQLLSQKTRTDDVGYVQAAKMWMLYNIVVSTQTKLRNWQVLGKENCLRVLAFLAILVVMVGSIILQSSPLDRAPVGISNWIACTLVVCICCYFGASCFTLRIKRGRLQKMLQAEIDAHETCGTQSFQVQSLNRKGEGSFDRMKFIQLMSQLTYLTNFEVVQVMTRAISNNNELEYLRTTILQFEICILVPFQMVNVHQCQHLCDYVAKIQIILTDLEDQVKNLPILEFVFQELFCTLKMAKLLVDCCRICKWSPEAIVLVHCEEYFIEVFMKLHSWMEVVKALYVWKVKFFGGVDEPLESYMPLLHASEMAKEIIALNKAAIKDRKVNIIVLNNYGVSGLDLSELNMISYLQKIVAQASVVHKCWKPPSFKEEIILDLTEDLLGVSSTGWVIKTKWAGGCYALKRVNDAKQYGMQAIVLASLWHPHIIQLVNYWKEKEKLFMLMEYMESGDLENFIAKKETLPLPVVIDMLIQVARAIYYLHINGIAHNDLKCANVLMTPNPTRESYYIMKLGGFGSAKRVLKMHFTSSQSIQVKDSRPHNAYIFKQDIYNFGLICKKSITQLVSVGYQSRLFELQKIHDSSIESLRLCIKMCQSKDPLQRPNCAKILRLLSLAQLQSLGIIIHTNEFFCLCNIKGLLLNKSMEEPIKMLDKGLEEESKEEEEEEEIDEELIDEVEEQVQELVEEPIDELVKGLEEEQFKKEFGKLVEMPQEEQLKGEVGKLVEESKEGHLEESMEESKKECLEDIIEELKEEHLRKLAKKSIEEHLGESMEEPKEEHIGKLVEKPKEKHLIELVEKLEKEQVRELVEKLEEDQFEKLVEKLEEEQLRELVEKFKEEQIRELVEKLEGKKVGELVEKPQDHIGKLVEKLKEDHIGKLVEKLKEDHIGKLVEKLKEEQVGELVEKSKKRQLEEVVEEPISEYFGELVEDSKEEHLKELVKESKEMQIEEVVEDFKDKELKEQVGELMEEPMKAMKEFEEEFMESMRNGLHTDHLKEVVNQSKKGKVLLELVKELKEDEKIELKEVPVKDLEEEPLKEPLGKQMEEAMEEAVKELEEESMELVKELDKELVEESIKTSMEYLVEEEIGASMGQLVEMRMEASMGQLVEEPMIEESMKEEPMKKEEAKELEEAQVAELVEEATKEPMKDVIKKKIRKNKIKKWMALVAERMESHVKSSLSHTQSITPMQSTSSYTRPITPVQSKPSSTHSITPMRSMPSSTQSITPMRSMPSSTQSITPIRLRPSSTRSITPIQSRPSSTRPITPIQSRPSSTRPITPIQSRPSSTRPITPVRSTPSFTRPITPMRLTSSSTRPITPMRPQLNVTGELPQSPSYHHGSPSMKPITSVAILWNMEKYPVPIDVNGEDVASNIMIELRMHPHIGAVTTFSAYGDFNHIPKKIRMGCQKTGVDLIDVPNGKDAADTALLTDMFLFTIDNPPPSTIVIVTGDLDFAPALHKLGQRGYVVVLLISNQGKDLSTLISAGRYVWDWPSLCRGHGLVEVTSISRQHTPTLGYSHNLYDNDVFGKEILIQHKPNTSNNALQIQYSTFPQTHTYIDSRQHTYGLFPRQIHTMEPNRGDLTELKEQLITSDNDVEKKSYGNKIYNKATICKGNKESKDIIVDFKHLEEIIGIVEDPIPNIPSVVQPIQGIQPCKSGFSSEAIVESISPSGTLSTQPGDLTSLKKQLVWLLNQNGGMMTLVKIPTQYSKHFGRPLYLAEYNVLKLVHLFEKMKDTMVIKNDGTSKTLHLVEKVERKSCNSKIYKSSNNISSIPKGNKDRKDNSHEDSKSEKVVVMKEMEVKEMVEAKFVTTQVANYKQLLDMDMDDVKPIFKALPMDWDSVCNIKEKLDVTNKTETIIDVQKVCEAENYKEDLKLASFKQELQELLVVYSYNIPLNNFIKFYQQRYARVLDLQYFKVDSLETLFQKVEDVAILKEKIVQGSSPLSKEIIVVAV